MGADEPRRRPQGRDLRRRRAIAPADPASVAGYASVVLVEAGLSHLERAFTYAVPKDMPLEPGAVVRVPFRGRRRVGVVVSLLDEPDVARTFPVVARLGPGLPRDVVDLAAWTGERYLATLGEALAAAVPDRVASEEESSDPLPPPVPDATFDRLRAFRNADALIAAIAARAHAGFVWRPRIDEARGETIVALAADALLRGGGVLIMIPEARARSEVAHAVARAFGGAVAWLGSDGSARDRYRAWVDLRSGSRRIAVGGRGAVFAPVRDLSLIVIDDEGHASYKEGRAPRFHARTVAAERARRAGATIVLVGVPGSLEAREATRRGPYTMVSLPRSAEVRGRPPVSVVERARLVPTARTLGIAKRALATGRRVAFLTHRTDAVAALAERAVRILSPRAPATIDARTPTQSIRRAAATADVIVATPVIAKDLALEGMGLLAICEPDAALVAPEFRAAEEAFATWWRASRWAAGGGQIVVETANPTHPAIVALTRWDPDVLWRADAERRSSLRYPPFASIARIDVPPERARAVVEELAAAAPGIEVLGPAERDGTAVAIARADRRDVLLDALRPVVSRWRADDEPMRVDVDPWEVFVPKWRS